MSNPSHGNEREPDDGLTSSSPFLWPAWFRRTPNMRLQEINEERDALSFDDQIHIEQERLGVLQYPVDETPQLISSSLRQLDDELAMIEQNEAYETALFIDPEYVESAEFRLPFLRADLFNVRAAARRVVKYWDRKLELFGATKAFKRTISIFDLEEEDCRALALGALRLLPYRDEAGRALIFRQSGHYPSSADSLSRLDWYMIHAATFDGEPTGIEIQKKGFCYISLIDIMGIPSKSNICNDIDSHNELEGGGGSLLSMSFTETVKYVKGINNDTLYALPMRPLSGMHGVVKNKWALLLLEHVLEFIDKKYRSKLNIIYSDFDEEIGAVDFDARIETFLIDLSSYGIPPEIIPKQIGGGLDYSTTTFVRERLQKDLAMAGVDLTKNNQEWEKQLPNELKKLLQV